MPMGKNEEYNPRLAQFLTINTGYIWMFGYSVCPWFEILISLICSCQSSLSLTNFHIKVCVNPFTPPFMSLLTIIF